MPTGHYTLLSYLLVMSYSQSSLFSYYTLLSSFFLKWIDLLEALVTFCKALTPRKLSLTELSLSSFLLLGLVTTPIFHSRKSPLFSPMPPFYDFHIFKDPWLWILYTLPTFITLSVLTVKQRRVFLSFNNYVASWLLFQFHWLRLWDSNSMIYPFILVTN